MRGSLKACNSIRHFARHFGWPADVRLNLQSHHDQQLAKEFMQAALAKIQSCPAL